MEEAQQLEKRLTSIEKDQQFLVLKVEDIRKEIETSNKEIKEILLLNINKHDELLKMQSELHFRLLTVERKIAEQAELDMCNQKEKIKTKWGLIATAGGSIVSAIIAAIALILR